MMEQRNHEAVESAIANTDMLRYLFIALGLVLMFFLWRTYRSLLDLVGTSVEQLKTDLHMMAEGDFSRPIKVPPGSKESLIGLLGGMQTTLKGDHRQGLSLHRGAIPFCRQHRPNCRADCPVCHRSANQHPNHGRRH